VGGVIKCSRVLKKFIDTKDIINCVNNQTSAIEGNLIKILRFQNSKFNFFHKIINVLHVKP